ncbi:MAG: CotH kinase family protein [Bacteroidales bacterium]|nr:CotH kinase family protein [Bacteroidales bacterium]
MMIFSENRYIYFVVILLLNLPVSIFAQVDFNSSDIPIIIIETNGQEILDEPRIVANMGIIDNGESMRNYLTDSINGYYGKISIEIRGATSQSFPKKQYGFETQNDDGSNNNFSLLGLPSENDWILFAPYSDKTLIRNILAYKLSESLGHYAPRTRLCELVLNGEYAGVYVLTEKIKRDNNRVDISKLNPNEISEDDLTGGYILKIDKSTGSNCYGWSTEIAKIYIQNEYPDCDNIVPEQKLYIQDYINSFEEALFSEHFADPVNGYRQFIDLDSFLDYFIINEISKNIDAYRLSTFMYKDKDSMGGKLSFGPVWDYNIAFGNADYMDSYKTNGLIATSHVWWNRLLQDTTFNNTLKTRWSEIRKEKFSNVRILNIIDSLVYILEESQQRNFQRWNILGNQVWPNYYIGHSYESEISFLKSWIINRLNWLDINLPGYYEDYRPFMDYETSIFPNPFDYFFTYVFSLEEAGNISLRLFDSSGRLITNIINNSYYEEGKHKIIWNSFLHNNIVPSTFYIITLEVNDRIVSKEKIIKKF